MLGYRSLVFSFELLAKFAVCDAWSFAMSIAFQKLRGDNHVIKKSSCIHHPYSSWFCIPKSPRLR